MNTYNEIISYDITQYNNESRTIVNTTDFKLNYIFN
jgi:hypothetical protein